MLDKFRGCILGGAMGDSLGYPVEFYNISFIKNHKLLKEPYNISLFSDDTQMTLFTAEGIIESNGNVLDYIYSAYKYWWATQMRSMPAGHKFVYQKEFLGLGRFLARTPPPLRGDSLVGGGMNRYLFNISFIAKRASVSLLFLVVNGIIILIVN